MSQPLQHELGITLDEFNRAKKLVYEAFEKARPELWAKCYPRIYHDVDNGYCSAKEVAAVMMGAAAKIEQGVYGENERAELVWASQSARYKVPIYWIGKEMAQAIQQTKPHMVITPRELKLPFEAATFMLPQGTLLHEGNEGEALFVSYVRGHAREKIPSLATNIPVLAMPEGNGAFSMFAHSLQGHFMHWTVPDYESVDLANLDDFISKFEEEWKQHTTGRSPLWPKATMDNADNRFMARAAHMIFGVVLLMSARPQLVKASTMVKRVQKKGSRPHEFWTAAKIGEGYKIRRVYEPKGGHHASPVFHWVRGHLKMQPHGPERKFHKEIWIEPYSRMEEICIGTKTE